ncbi:MAG: SsrA-binding protein SmpB [Candidatus Omnitrophota bacterium]|jgi:SsrA-binding protein|nr:MAG: SsrA-binding protein SmpB [Candidatus Omnitrophota bacterium]
MKKVVVTNRKAYRDYSVLDSIECGIELKGCEVKSIREGRINLDDSFARLDGSEIILYNAQVSPYEKTSYFNEDPVRPRKLLLHRSQIEKIAAQIMRKGITLVPLKVYFTQRGFAKIELALCKGKRQFDKREDIKRRETSIEMRRMMKSRRPR